MAELKPIAFRLKPDVHQRIAEMAEASNRPKTAVVEQAISAAYERHRSAVREGQERARQATGLLAELRRRLGEDVFVGSGEVAFTSEGPVAIEANGVRYELRDDGEIFASRLVSGSRHIALVTETGLGEWLTTPPPEPTLN